MKVDVNSIQSAAKMMIYLSQKAEIIEAEIHQIEKNLARQKLGNEIDTLALTASLKVQRTALIKRIEVMKIMSDVLNQAAAEYHQCETRAKGTVLFLPQLDIFRRELPQVYPTRREGKLVDGLIRPLMAGGNE